jgi:integrase
VNLTDTEVKRSRPTDKPYKLTDGRGLFLLVKPNGAKLWRYKYSFAGKEKLMALGAYPVVTLAMARDRHLDARRVLSSGSDPMEARKAEAAQGITFREVAEQWYANWRANKSARYGDYVQRRLNGDIYPAIGSRPIAQITTPMVVGIAKRIESRGAYEIARRAMETVGQIMRYGVAHGHCERDVTKDVKPSDVLKATTKGNHARVKDEELSGVVAALYRHPGIITRMACKLTMYTALRTANVIGLEWAWVKLDEARIDFPADTMKTRTPFICLLSDQAVSVLAAMRQFSDGARYVFPGQKPGVALSNGAMLKALRDAGFGGKHTMHAFRAVFSTWAHETGYEHDHIERCLHHQKRGVSAHYDFAVYLPQRRELMAVWSRHLDGLAAKALLTAVAAD